MCEVSVLFHRFARSNQTKPDPIWPMDCVPRISKMYVKGPWHKSLTLKSLKWNAICKCLQITNTCLWRLHILGELLIHSFIAMKFFEANKRCHELDRSSFNLCQRVSMLFFSFHSQNCHKAASWGASATTCPVPGCLVRRLSTWQSWKPQIEMSNPKSPIQLICRVGFPGRLFDSEKNCKLFWSLCLRL